MAGIRRSARRRTAAPLHPLPPCPKGHPSVRSSSPSPFVLPHRFGSSPPFTVGAEEELFLVDPATDRVVLGTGIALGGPMRHVQDLAARRRAAFAPAAVRTPASPVLDPDPVALGGAA
jgi:hypothetical protein